MIKFESTVVSNKMLTSDVFEIVFEYPSNTEFSFNPGQFIMVHVDETTKPPVRRAYSIVNPPSEIGIIRLWVKYKEKLTGPSYLHTLKADQKCTLSGPYGQFATNNDEKALVFIATGTGIAPFNSMIADLIENEDKRQIELVFGVRHKEDLFSYNTFTSWQNTYENFSFLPTLSKAPDDWEGLKGRVTDVVPEAIKDHKNKSFYICGIPQMVTDMQTLLLELGCDKDNIHIEKY